MSNARLSGGDEAAGPNPNYKGPPKNRWHTVEVVAAEGTELGLVADSEHGELTIICRRAGEPWPHGMSPIAGGVNTIAPGHRVYCVRSDEHQEDLPIRALLPPAIEEPQEHEGLTADVEPIAPPGRP